MQNHRIAIDWGNTRVKVGIFQNDNRLIFVHNFSQEEAKEKIMRIMQDRKFPPSILCSVHENSHSLITALEDENNLLVMDSNTKVPLVNAYGTPETLGMDRLALAVGAKEAFPNQDCLIIAAGSAITYNFIQSSGFFRGGAISPGIDMRLKSLHEYSNQLPLVEKDGYCPLIGHETATSIRSGVLYGIAAEIESMIDYYKTQYPNIKSVLTGGTVSYIHKKLKNKIHMDEAILLRGLNAIMIHNEK
ncbi:MAG TPA: type III pantothenate kinase [Chitinophagaceae bacterium]|nr:type III pantothenate kinase [Chitinophagaceae bacterium]